MTTGRDRDPRRTVGEILEVGQAEFEREVLLAAVPVLADFHAEWCAPCKWLDPILKELARERAGGVLVVKVDTDQAPRLAARYGIRSVPTVILFRDGEEVERSLGVEPERLRAMAGES